MLAAKLSKDYTSDKLSPVIGPEKASGGNGGNSGGAGVPTAPDGDCDADGVKNAVDLDDDNDLLPDGLELALLLDPCVGDTDGDGVEDGYEYQSAIDLNNDDYQTPNVSLPYPGKTPYPNPLFKDGDVDYDGDGLTAATSTSSGSTRTRSTTPPTRTLSPLSYSDGTQYSLSMRRRQRPPYADDDDRRLHPAADVPQLGRPSPATRRITLRLTGSTCGTCTTWIATAAPRRRSRPSTAGDAPSSATGICEPTAGSPTTSATRTPTA